MSGWPPGAGEAVGRRAWGQSTVGHRDDRRVSVTVWGGEAKLGRRARGRGSANAVGKWHRATGSSTDRRGNPGRAWREQRQRVSRRSGAAVEDRARAFAVPRRLGCPIADSRELPLWVDSGLSPRSKADAYRNVRFRGPASAAAGQKRKFSEFLESGRSTVLPAPSLPARDCRLPSP